MINKKNGMKQVRDAVSEDVRKLVVARIRAASGDLNVSIGSAAQNYTREDLIRKVESGDEIGREIINIQMEYLKDVVQGKIYKLDDAASN